MSAPSAPSEAESNRTEIEKPELAPSGSSPESCMIQIRGVVGDAFENPIPGASVEFSLDKQAETIGTATTNNVGEYEIHATVQKSDPLRVRGRAWGPGFQADSSRWRFRSSLVLEGADFHLDAGTDVYGSVRSPAGEAIAYATVYFLTDDVLDSTATDEEGAFHFPISSAETYEVWARQDHIGIGERQKFFLSIEQPHHLDLILEGTSSLSGRVVTPSGTPLSDVRLRAFLEEFLTSRGVQLDDYRPPRSWRDKEFSRYERKGLAVAYAMTDDEGHFRFPALEPGRYAVHTHLKNSEFAHWIVATGNHDLEFVLAKYLLRIRVLNHHDSPMSTTSVSLTELQTGRKDIQKASKGVATFEVRPGQRYVAEATAMHGSPYTVGRREITVPRELYQQEVDIRLLPVTSMGKLTVIAEGEDGTDLPKVDLTVCSMTTRAPLWSSNSHQFSLPPGEYLLRGSSSLSASLNLREQYEREFGSVRRRSCCQWLPTETIVTIGAGLSQEQTLRFKRGGHLAIRFVDHDLQEPAIMRSYSHRVPAISPVGEELVLKFVRAAFHDKSRTTLMVTRKLLEPGLWTLKADPLGSGQPTLHRAEIRAGELVEVDISLPH